MELRVGESFSGMLTTDIKVPPQRSINTMIQEQIEFLVFSEVGEIKRICVYLGEGCLPSLNMLKAEGHHAKSRA